MCLYDVTVVTLGTQASGVSGVGVGCCGNPCNEAQFVSYSHTRRHMEIHTLKLANFKSSKCIEQCDYGRLAVKINRFISSPFLSLPLTPLCFSAPLSVIVTLCKGGPPFPCTLPIRPHLHPDCTFPIFLQCLPLSPGEDCGRMKLWLRWYIWDNKAEWLSFASLSCTRRLPRFLHTTLHALFPLSSGQFGHW